jgi:Ca-activated chloride channel family protein
MIRPVKQMSPESWSQADAAVDGEHGGFGALETARGCLPLTALNVKARITGLCAHVKLEQTFRNASDEPLEATYIFPLPDRAAVTSFRMRVGERIVEGQLKERGQARQEYQQAIEAGHRASIAEEERSGTFNLRVGNIPPRENIAVELTLTMPLAVARGEAEFRFPLVVAPRYASGMPLDGPSVGAGWASDTDAVPDASRVTPPVLLPGFPNPVQLGLEVEIDPAGLDGAQPDWAAGIACSLHSVLVEAGPPWKVRLQPGERLNRDFLLRFPIAAKAVQTTLLSADGNGKSGEPATFALTLVPPILSTKAKPAPRDVVIVLDRSGSMGGWKMVAARRAVGRMVDTLLDDDRFTVLAFDERIEQPPHAAQLVPATNRNRWRALEWLGKIDARGGTEMAPALKSAAALLGSTAAHRRPIVVLVTDGQVAGEDAILRTLKQASGERVPHIYALGIDRSVNAGFLKRLAGLGGGSCDLVETESRLDEAMDHIHRAIGQPVLTGLRVEAVEGGIVADSLSPERLPDLFADRPVTIFGRLSSDNLPLRIRVTAVGGDGQHWQQVVAAHPARAATLRSLWGRARVRDLEDRYAAGTSDPAALEQRIVAVSLSSGVLSRFTAYVAVDRSEVVNKGGHQQQIVQPVEMPEGWEAADTLLCAAPMTAGTVYRGIPMATDDEMLLQCEEPCVDVSDSHLRAFGSQASGGIFGFFGAFSNIGKARHAYKRGLAPRPLDQRALKKQFAALDKLIQPVDDSGRVNLRGRRRVVVKLIQLLDNLPGQVETLPTADVFIITSLEEAARKARELLDDYNAGNRAALSAAALNPLFEDVRQALAKLTATSASPAAPSAERKRFWT